MIRSWQALMVYLEEQDCYELDDQDWGYPIWRCRGTGKDCGLDLNCEIDDFLICSICARLGIDTPNGHDSPLRVAQRLRDDINGDNSQ